VCATACLAGVFRSAISLVVLVVEGTRGINFLFGIIIAVVVANWVASALEHEGIYESEVRLSWRWCIQHAALPSSIHHCSAPQGFVIAGARANPSHS
jgi:Voltage gated chloride channel